MSDNHFPTPPRDGMSRSESGPHPSRCGCGDETVRIDLLIDGEHLSMLSCSKCDTRSWHRAGEAVELGGVLTDLSATRTRYRRDLAAQ